MIWKTRLVTEEIPRPDQRPLRLEIEELESLEETIDELFLELDRTGNASLLEELSPYFGCLWPSARALAQYLLSEDIERDGPVHVLEVGCGLAFPSLALASTVKASRILATDFHPEVPQFLTRNLERNGISPGKFEYRKLDWTARDAAEIGRFGLVIGSDVLYEKAHPADVADALVSWVRPGGRIIVADPVRPYLQGFVDEMRARGYSAEPKIIKLPADPHRVDRPEKEVVILDFKRIRLASR